jgi:hypothetical protein
LTGRPSFSSGGFFLPGIPPCRAAPGRIIVPVLYIGKPFPGPLPGPWAAVAFFIFLVIPEIVFVQEKIFFIYMIGHKSSVKISFIRFFRFTPIVCVPPPFTSPSLLIGSRRT